MKLVTLLFIVSAVLIVLYEFVRKKKSAIDIVTLFNFWFLISYIIVPAICINDIFYVNKFFVRFQPDDDLKIFFSYIYIMLFYTAVILGYKFSSGRASKIMVVYKKRFTWDKFSIALLGIALLGLSIYIIGYGGLTRVLSNINLIRSGKVERNTIAAFARMFSNYSVVAMIISFGKLKTAKRYKIKSKAFFLFVFSMGVVIFSSVLSGGRGGLISPFLLVFFANVYIDKKWKITKLVLIVPIVFFVILYGKEFFVSILNDPGHVLSLFQEDIENIRYMLKGVIGEFTHPFYSLQVAMDVTRNGNNLFFFRNIPYTFLFFSYLFGFPYHGTISHYNTEHIFGVFDSNIPPGLVALGYYNLYFMGVIIAGLVYGWFLGIIQSFFQMLFRNKGNFEITLALYLVIASSITPFIFNGDIRVLIMSNITRIILLLYIFLFNSKIFRLHKGG